MLRITNIQLELIADADAWELDILIFLRDITKPTINIWNLMNKDKNQNKCTYTRINHTVMGYLDSKKMLTSLVSLRQGNAEGPKNWWRSMKTANIDR